MKERLKKLAGTRRQMAALIGGCALMAVAAITAVILCIRAGGGPKVTLGDYTGIPLTLSETEVTDADVEAAAGRYIQYYNENSVSARTIIEAGDTVNIESEAYDMDGNALDIPEVLPGSYTAGEGGSYPELSEALAGAEVGKELSIEITLPDPCEPDASLSGKRVSVRVTPVSIRGEELSHITLTDAQVQEAFGEEGVDAFYAGIRKDLEESAKKDARSSAYGQICTHLLDTCTVEGFPEDELKARLDAYMESVEESCGDYYDMTPEEYYEALGMTKDEYRESLTEDLREKITLELIFKAIAEKEGIECGEKGFEDYVDGIIKDGGLRPGTRRTRHTARNT